MKNEKQQLTLAILNNGKYRVNQEGGYIESFRKGIGEWKKLSGSIASSGYLQHTLHLGRGLNSKVIVYAHIAVYIGVNGVYDEGLVINHKDLDRFNNRPDNLEAVSVKENIIHANNNVDFSKNISVYTKLIRYDEICAIKKLLVDHPNWTKARIARELGLNRIPVTRVINKIKNGEELKYEVPGKRPSPMSRFKII